MRLGTNYLTGTLEPLRNCTALHGLGVASNQLTGSLEPLQDCKALLGLDLRCGSPHVLGMHAPCAFVYLGIRNGVWHRGAG